VVLARGVLPCKLLFIGEAPGPTEDAAGFPFIGRSGEILDKMIQELTLRVGPISYAITNAVACFPHDVVGIVTDDGVDSNQIIRPPAKEEIQACSPRLTEFLNIANPVAVVLLGKSAVKAFKGHTLKQTLELQHPAFILRNGGHNSVSYHRNFLRLLEFVKAKVL